jgi:hypothetical protein
MACFPKWVFAGELNVKVTFENVTFFAPRTQIVSVDGFPNSAGPPFPVT